MAENTDQVALDLAAEFPVPSLAQWRERAEAELKGVDIQKRLWWKTLEGLTVEPIYAAEHLKDLPHLDGLPGEAPFVRGAKAGRGWLIAQECGLRSPEEVNAVVRDGLAKGQTAVRIILDQAVKRGLDGDMSAASAMVGVEGCTLTSINGLRVALADIDLEKTNVSIEAGASAGPVLGALMALARERDVSTKSLKGCVGGDPLAELVRVGELPLPVDVIHREMAGRVAWCAEHAPGIRPILASGHVYQEAGATIIQELAATLASATEQLRALIEAGIDPNTAAKAISFTVSVTPNLYLEIAKLRAARLLWAKIVKAFGAEDAEAQRMWCHVRTGTYTSTVPDMHSNLIRSTVQTFVGAVGGCDSLSVTPFDQVAGQTSELGRRMARNQQVLLEEESHLSRVADPLGGSHVIEALTDAIGREAWTALQGIEAEGGLLAALQSGSLQKAIAEKATERQKLLSTRRTTVVGVTNYINQSEKPLEPKRDDHEAFVAERRKRVERLRSVRGNRQVAELVASLAKQAGKDLMDATVNAAEAGATIGEMMAALAAGSDESVAHVAPLVVSRATVPFEALRARTQAFAEKTGKVPEILLVPMGALAMRRARADFCSNFLGASGMDITEPEPFADAAAAAKGIIESGAPIAVLCADDPTYPEVAPTIVEKVKAAKPDTMIVVAGYPADTVEQLRAAGVDEFVHLRADQMQMLTTLQAHCGMEVE